MCLSERNARGDTFGRHKSFIVQTGTYSHLILVDSILGDEYFTFVNVSSLRHRDVYDTILLNVI